MQIFQQIHDKLDPEEICNMDFNFPLGLPVHLHCKDLQGKYIACNDRVMQDVGIQTKKDMLGRTDYEFDCLGENEAENFRTIDRLVLANEQTNFFTQSVTLADNQKYLALNHKTPLRSRENKIIGVLSFGIIVNQSQSPYLDPDYPVLNMLFSAKSKTFQSLSQRQVDCLYFLVRGYSIKEIAKKLVLSPRTVEHYLEAVKDKFNCKSRSELIEKILANI